MRCFTPTKCLNGQKYCAVRRKTLTNKSRPSGNGMSAMSATSGNAMSGNGNTRPQASIMDMSCRSSKAGDVATVKSTKQLPSRAKAEANKPIMENIANKLASMKVKRKNITFSLD
jgi:hypothetical protein